MESFCQEVEDCLQRQHYESSSLAVLARNLQEKFGAVGRITSEKLHIIRSSVEFHCNINNVRYPIFSVRDTRQRKGDPFLKVHLWVTSPQIGSFLQRLRRLNSFEEVEGFL